MTSQYGNQVGEYEEWRVQADHRDPFWKVESPPYDFIWSPRINGASFENGRTAEEAAKFFASSPNFQRNMTNIQITHRTVTIGEWRNDDAGSTDQGHSSGEGSRGAAGGDAGGP